MGRLPRLWGDNLLTVNPMPFAPIFALSIPAIALVLLVVLGAIPRTRSITRFILPATATLSLLGVLATRLEPLEAIVLSRWSPEVLLGVSPILRTDPQVWPLALATAASVTGASLVQLSRRPRPPFTLEIALLGILTAVLASLWGNNPLAVLLAWGWSDMMWVLGVVAAGGPSQRLAWGAGANLLATALLWAATLAIGARGSLVSSELASLEGPGRSLLLVACLLRIGLYPLHLAISTEGAWDLPAAAPLLLGPVMGWGMLSRVAAAGEVGLLTGAPWLMGMGLAAFVAGAFLAWACPRPREGVPWIGLAANGLLLWGGLSTHGEGGTAIVLGATAWTLGVSLLVLSRGWRRTAWWWAVPPLIGGWALLGGPLTPAALALSYVAASAASAVGRGTVLFVGTTLLTGAMARRIFRSAPEEAEEPLRIAARAVGMALPAMLLLLVGVLPSFFLPRGVAIPWWGHFSGRGLIGWGVWLVAVGGGVALARTEGRFRRRLMPILRPLADLVDLEWAYSLVVGGLRRAVRFLKTTAELVEGAGAVFWALVLFLLLVSLVIQRGG